MNCSIETTAILPTERSSSHETVAQESFREVQSSIALEALRGDAALAQLAARHSVHANQIATWRKQLLEHAGEVFDNGSPALNDAERRSKTCAPK